MLNRETGYARPFEAPYLPPVTLPAVRASLGGRTLAYLLDIVFILAFSALLWVAIALVGLVTFGLGWTLFAVLPASGVIYSAITVGGSGQATLGQRMLGLRVVAPESGARVDLVTAAVHALLFYVAVSTFLLWFVDLAFGLVRGDRRLGHDVLLGLAVVRAP